MGSTASLRKWSSPRIDRLHKDTVSVRGPWIWKTQSWSTMASKTESRMKFARAKQCVKVKNTTRPRLGGSSSHHSRRMPPVAILRTATAKLRPKRAASLSRDITWAAHSWISKTVLTSMSTRKVLDKVATFCPKMARIETSKLKKDCQTRMHRCFSSTV